MKTKNKMLAVVEIAIVLCSVFLVAMPAIAADQNQTMQKVSASASTITTASEDDYVLGVYGNANEDDTIDMRDLTYVKLIFFGKKPETELADAKYDGKINPLDFIQIKLIIVGREKELTYEDLFGEAETVCKPVNRIVIGYYDRAEMLQTLDANDKVVGIDKSTKKKSSFFSELSNLPIAGDPFKPNYEAILSLHADVYMPYLTSVTYNIEKKKECKEKLPSVTIVCLDMGHDIENFPKQVRTLGYILDRQNEAEEFIDFYKGIVNKIKSRTEAISEDEKPRVYVEFHQPYFAVLWLEPCDLAGGRNIGADLGKKSFTKVDPEWVIEQTPDFIIKKASAGFDYEMDDPSDAATQREEYFSRSELANVNAVKSKRVYIIASTHLTIGPGHLIGAVYMAKLFHPNLFEDLDPEAIHQEYLARFHHLDYDLDEHGVFVYPPIEIDGGLAGIPDRYKGQI
jgi:iron complex transport system substrate-binding protein